MSAEVLAVAVQGIATWMSSISVDLDFTVKRSGSPLTAAAAPAAPVPQTKALWSPTDHGEAAARPVPWPYRLP